MVTAIIFILVLSVLVFVHEFGHFWTAKKMGMDVEEFGFGFPPRAWGKKIGDTLYSINWLPLGGFVKIKGEDGSHRDDPRSFAAQKAWKRILVLSAGVVMNFFFAAIILSVGYMFGLPQAVDGVNVGNVRDVKVQIIDVVKGSPAKKAELKTGDIIKTVNSKSITSSQQLVDFTNGNLDKTVTFGILRNGELINKDIEIKLMKNTGKGGIGVSLLETGVVSYSFFKAIYKGFEASWSITVRIVVGFYNIIVSLIQGKGAGMAVSGPVGIAVMTGQVASLGFAYLLQFTALLSLNLAVLNFLPFPALDGGRVVFVLLEKLRGKPVSEKIEGAFHATGFLLLMLLVVVITYKDIVNIFR